MQVSAPKRNNGKLLLVCVLECEAESRLENDTRAERDASKKRRNQYQGSFVHSRKRFRLK